MKLMWPVVVGALAVGLLAGAAVSSRAAIIPAAGLVAMTSSPPRHATPSPKASESPEPAESPDADGAGAPKASSGGGVSTAAGAHPCNHGFYVSQAAHAHKGGAYVSTIAQSDLGKNGDCSAPLPPPKPAG